MNKLAKKLLAAGLSLGLALGTMTGCGNSNAAKAVATVDGVEISYGLVNFMTRYNQAQMQSMYGSMLGDNMWDSYGSTMKSGVVESFEQMVILEKHMDEYGVTVSDEEKQTIADTAKAFIESNDKDVLEAMTADQATVERMLTLTLINKKMQLAIIKDVDTEVSDEEAAQKTVQYVFFSTADTKDDEGNTVAKTDDEKAAMKQHAEEILDAVRNGKSMEDAAKAIDESLNVAKTSYGTDNGSIDATLKAAVDGLKDGECAAEVVETDNGYYAAQMVSTFDKEATENQKKTIVNQRKSDKFSEVYDAWKEAAEITTDDALIEEITFKDTFEMKSTETESAAETEAGTEGSSETQAESASESETAAE